MMHWYIDLQQNSVTFISEDYSEDEDLVDLIENDVDQERFIPIPRCNSREGYRQMERFIEALDDAHKQEVLYSAIDGKDSFHRFKDAVYRVGLSDQWHEFKNREDRADVLQWLHGEGLIEEADIEKGSQMYEKNLASRKRREANLQKMVKGATVICSGNSGHVEQVTPGKTYEVLDEQQQQLNIRIRDDRDRLIWIPKAHFELVTEA